MSQFENNSEQDRWRPENNVERERLEKLRRIHAQGIDPYPHRVARTHTIAEAIAAYELMLRGASIAGRFWSTLQRAWYHCCPALQGWARTARNMSYEKGEAAPSEGQEPESIPVTVAGRIVAHRPKGKMSFAHIEDGTGRVQIWLKEDIVGEAVQRLFNDDLDLFDFVEAQGTMTRTKRGEVSVLVERLRLLAKALSPLPVIKEQALDGGAVRRYGEFTDPEERFRQRYADLAVNPEVRETFRIRARAISAVRRFLDQEGFLEVETPVLQPLYGGAAARPFTTFHNELKEDLYLRISFELYLKRLLVGMYDAVYEIGRDFRNEGVDRTHNPEFTQMEFYQAYIDYHGVMDIVERMVRYVVQEVRGTQRFVYQGHPIDVSQPFERVTLRDAILEFTGIDYTRYPDAASLARIMQKHGRQPQPDSTWGKLVDSLLGSDVQPHLIQPTFLIDYPRDISPLAKMTPDDPEHVERFEFFIGGMEMGNAFTEINDPLDQEQRFIDMGRLYGMDQEESHPIDQDYLRAMRYGMPPNGGFGMGLDRLAMLLADRPNIREVLLFPAMRRRTSQPHEPDQDEP